MKTDTIDQHLTQLKNQLIAASLWQDTPPTSAQLSSQEPFCVDTLPFEGWLQWVFIPKLRQLIGSPNFNGLHHTSDIHTMADYAFKDYQQDTAQISTTIKLIDEALNSMT